MSAARLATVGAVSRLARHRLDDARAQAARLDAKIASAERRLADAELVARMQRDAIARIDASARGRMVGESVSERSLSAAASRLRAMIERLAVAQAQVETAKAQVAAAVAERDAFQPRLRRAGLDAERWREARDELRRDAAWAAALAREEAAADDLMDRAGSRGSGLAGAA